MSNKVHLDLTYNIFGQTMPLPLFDESSRTKEIILLESTILFAKRGYDAVSVRDIATQIGIKPSSLYNHFVGKEALFEAVLKHAEDLYLLYFKRLDEAIASGTTFEEVLDIIFHEPSKMTNSFTCYAFSLIQTEQFRDPYASSIYHNTFMAYSIDFFKNWFDTCVDKGLVPPFDTKTVSFIILQNSLLAVNLKVHDLLNNQHAYSFPELFYNLKRMILTLTGADKQQISASLLGERANLTPPKHRMSQSC
jgi:AcrR family transcriptional regulator